MLRPRIQAPIPVKPCSAIPLSMPVSPPSWPCIFRHLRDWKNHSISSGPRTPSGFWRSWSGPAPKPSREIAKLRTRSFDMAFLAVERGGPAGARTELGPGLRDPGLPPVHPAVEHGHEQEAYGSGDEPRDRDVSEDPAVD